MTVPLDSRYFEIREELLGRRAHELVTKDDLMILGDVMYGDSGLLRIYGLSIDDLSEGGFCILGRNLTAMPANNGERFRTEAAQAGEL
jgi:hypothetical protein